MFFKSTLVSFFKSSLKKKTLKINLKFLKISVNYVAEDFFLFDSVENKIVQCLEIIQISAKAKFVSLATVKMTSA